MTEILTATPTAAETPLLILDVDGTVRQGKEDDLGRWCNSPEDVVVFPEAVVGMMRWKAAGGRVIWTSNQGGIALGYVTVEQVQATMDETVKQVHQIAVKLGLDAVEADLLVDRVEYCPHHSNAENYKQARCWCRKPSPGMIVRAATELGRLHGETYPAWMSLMVGDLPVDGKAAQNAGVMFFDATFWRANMASFPTLREKMNSDDHS
jgi:D-glycero-D-manno-heptose 1,7-bisphosphate phosphatase